MMLRIHRGIGMYPIGAQQFGAGGLDQQRLISAATASSHTGR